MSIDNAKLLEILEKIPTNPYLINGLSDEELSSETGIKIINTALKQNASVLLQIPNSLHTLELGKLAVECDYRSFLLFKNGSDTELFLQCYDRHPDIISYIERKTFLSLVNSNKININVFFDFNSVNENNFSKRLDIVLFYFLKTDMFLSIKLLNLIFDFCTKTFQKFKEYEKPNFYTTYIEIIKELKNRNFTVSTAILQLIESN